MTLPRLPIEGSLLQAQLEQKCHCVAPGWRGIVMSENGEWSTSSWPFSRYVTYKYIHIEYIYIYRIYIYRIYIYIFPLCTSPMNPNAFWGTWGMILGCFKFSYVLTIKHSGPIHRCDDGHGDWPYMSKSHVCFAVSSAPWIVTHVLTTKFLE